MQKGVQELQLWVRREHALCTALIIVFRYAEELDKAVESGEVAVKSACGSVSPAPPNSAFMIVD